MGWTQEHLASLSAPRPAYMPGWVNWDRYEDYQGPVVSEIVDRFREGNQLVVLSCPTGGGKTIIAESVRQLLNARGLYLCSSLTLMDQFVRDFPYAKLIKGRKNYIPTDAEGDVTCEDCTYDPETKACAWCSDPDKCDYRVARTAARMGRLACSNTSYFLREVKSSKSSLSQRKFTVLDEADRLEDELLGDSSISLSIDMQRLLKLQPPAKKTVQSAWEDWFTEALPRVAKMAKDAPERSVKEERRKRMLSRLSETMTYIASHLDNYVFTGYERDRIEFKPITAQSIGKNALWQHGERFLAMSATMGSPEAFVQSTGFEGPWAYVAAPSAFPVERRPVYFFPAARMIRSTQETAWPKMATVTRAVIERHPDERILVHTHAYKWTEYLFEQLMDMPRPVITYLNARDRQSAIEEFESTPGSVFLAPSLERGYNGKDDLVRVVIVTKCMFPNLGDKQVSARMYSTGGSLWYASKTADALCQALGRGMRHENDYMAGYILDEQFATFYGKWKDGKEHRLFPSYFTDALDWNSDAAWELKQSLRGRSTP